MSRRAAVVMVLVGAVLFLIGTAMFWLPLAFLVAGGALVAGGLVVFDVKDTPKG